MIEAVDSEQKVEYLKKNVEILLLLAVNNDKNDVSTDTIYESCSKVIHEKE